MFCTNCGEGIDERSSFCNKCGQYVAENRVAYLESSLLKKKFATYKDLTPELLEKLKLYQIHTNMSCLECGYSGLMGVTSTVAPWYCSLWFWAPAFILLSLTGVGFIAIFFVGAFIGVISFYSQKKHTVCPSCDKSLVSKKQI